MREEDTTAAAIHGGFTQQMKGEQISRGERQNEGVESQREGGNTGMNEGPAIHKDTGWHSSHVAG